MKIINLILISTLTLTAIGCGNLEREKTPAELKMELKLQENKHPTLYMQLENVTLKRNKIKEETFFSNAKYDGYLLTGQAVNSATMAEYKDLKILVELYSKTKTVIDRQTYVLYEFYKPNSSKSFSIKVDATASMDTYGAFIDGISPSY